jgi:hypothetical protein
VGNPMVRLFDSTFILGSVLVVVALAIALAAVMKVDLPVIGTGTGALLAVAVIGMAGCAVGGISQAPTLGWTAPTVIFGTVLGVAALLVIGAGLFGWTPVLEPIARFVPAQFGPATGAQTAIFALAALIGVKWIVAIGMALLAR